MQVLVASLIGAFGGGVIAQRFRRLLIPAHRDLWQNVWKSRHLADFTINIRHALASGAVGGAASSSLGRAILPYLEDTSKKIGLSRYF